MPSLKKAVVPFSLIFRRRARIAGVAGLVVVGSVAHGAGFFADGGARGGESSVAGGVAQRISAIARK